MEKQSFLLEKSALKRFVSPLFRSNSAQTSLALSQGNFRDFLSSVVLVRTRDFANSSLDTRITEVLRESIAITNCIFKNIESVSDGGAICLDSFMHMLFIDSSGFEACKCQSTGGAIYLYGVEMRILRSCFSLCEAGARDQAISSDLSRFSSNTHKNSIIQSNFYKCAPSKTGNSKRSNYLAGGSQMLESLNFTENCVQNAASSVFSSFPSNFSIKFTVFDRCQGSNMVWLHMLQQEFLLDNCNVLRNEAESSSSLFIMDRSVSQVTSFAFIGNKADKYFDGDCSIRLINCVFDVHRSPYMFGNARMNVIDVKFGQKRAQPRNIPFIQSWGCWAVGEPSPTVILSEATMSISVIKTMPPSRLAVVIIGGAGLLAILGYFIWTFFQTPDGFSVLPVALKNA